MGTPKNTWGSNSFLRLKIENRRSEVQRL